MLHNTGRLWAKSCILVQVEPISHNENVHLLSLTNGKYWMDPPSHLTGTNVRFSESFLIVYTAHRSTKLFFCITFLLYYWHWDRTDALKRPTSFHLSFYPENWAEMVKRQIINLISFGPILYFSWKEEAFTKVELISIPAPTQIFNLFPANIWILKFRFC